jgi:glyoxylase-like metal-dependent hydrolase (beta-lactamase superfamily II)
MSSDFTDIALSKADHIVTQALHDATRRPVVGAFFDAATSSFSYVVRDPASNACAVIDSVLDFDSASGRTGTQAADALIEHLRDSGSSPAWILETHVHADHLSAAPYIQKQCGGKTGIGDGIAQVQRAFANVFDDTSLSDRPMRGFDQAFCDGASFKIGQLDATVLHVPGHTHACVAYVIGDAVFTGDTLFMPDYGTARCDFPGGDAQALYRSVRRLLQLPGDTRLFICHDYLTPTRNAHRWQTTVLEQRQQNVHIHDGIDEPTFVTMRQRRDATLAMPRLLLPSVQVNLRAGQLPPAEANGVRYLKIPLDVF